MKNIIRVVLLAIVMATLLGGCNDDKKQASNESGQDAGQKLYSNLHSSRAVP